MEVYKTALLVVHVLSAIIGVGSSFTFGVLGSLMGRIQGEGTVALLEASDAIEKRLTNPFALALLPLTGVLMIFSRGWGANFFDHQWLMGAIVLFIILASLASGVLSPGARKLLALAKSGQAGSPEFLRLVGVQTKVGPITSILGVAIVVLMVWKPGG